jgi:hypothetical protein
MEPLKYSIADIIERSRESRSTVCRAIARGDLKTFLVGRRRFARPEAVRAWIDFLEKQSDRGKPVKYMPRTTEAQ